MRDGATGRVRDGTLLALAAFLPLGFNPFGVQAFEPLKMILVRLAAALILACAALDLLSRRPLPGMPRRGPVRLLFLGGALSIGATGLATACSILPLQSLLGSYDRLQGLLSVLAVGVVGFAAAGAKRPARLVDSLLLGSMPVCLYALVQHVRLDPAVWLERTSGPASTLGSSTALGGYLAMLAPLTLARGFEVGGALRGPGGPTSPLRDRRVWLGAGLMTLGTLQAFVVVVSDVSGALLGLVGGLMTATGVGLWATRRGLVAPLALVAAVIVVTMAGLRTAPSAPAAVSPTDLSAQERVLIWRAAGDVWLASGPRLLVGFGPETQTVSLEARFPLELANRWPDLRFDRAHNLVLDQLLTSGLVGLAALLLLLASGLSTALELSRSDAHRWTAAALAGALVAHVVERSFAFESAGTLLVFWLSLGLLAALGRSTGEPAASRVPTRRTRVLTACLLGVVAGGLVLAALSAVAADLAHRRALAYHGGKDLRGEIAWLRRAAALAPNQDVYRLALGEALAAEALVEASPGRRASLLEEAERRLDEAIALNPLDPYGHFHLGRALELRAEAEPATDARDRAVVAYARAAELSPRRALFHDAAGRALHLAGRPAEALARYEAAQSLTGVEGERLAFMGDSLIALDREGEALAAYREALTLAPRTGPAHAGLATLLHRRGDLAGALVEAHLAARYQMRDWRHRETLARLELEAGNRGTALIQARAASRLAPPWERRRLRVWVDELQAGR